MIRTATGRQAGFTLLEILVALVVLGLLLAALAGGVDFGLRTWTMQSRVIDRSSEIEAVDTTLRRLVTQADPGLDEPRGNFSGTAHHLEFATTLPAALPGEAPLAVIVALDLDQRHRLVLSWLPAPHARRLAPPPPPSRAVLLDGVAAFDASYLGANGWQQDWSDPSVPSLVRLHLGFVSTGRVWPDIVAAPTRQSLQQ